MLNFLACDLVNDPEQSPPKSEENSSNNSDENSENETDPSDNIPPADISKATADVIDNDSLLLTWEAVGEDGMEGAAARYTLGFSTNPLTDNDSCTSAPFTAELSDSSPAGTMLSYQVDGLLPQTDYYFCVFACDANDTRNNWSLGEVAARINPAPADITVANIAAVAFDTIRIEWDAVGEDNLTGSASRYEIGYSASAINNDQDCSAATVLDPDITPQLAGSPMVYELGGLTNQTTYYLCIRAYDAEDLGNQWTFGQLVDTTPEGTAGWGPWSDFGPCSVNCGGGTMTQTRLCVTPADGCAGSGLNTVACNTGGCATSAKSTTFMGAWAAQSCDPGYHVTSVSCSAGQIGFEGFDYFCPVCACGLLSRGGAYHNQSVVSSSGVGTGSGSCSMSRPIDAGGMTDPCQQYIGIPGRTVHPFGGAPIFIQSVPHSISIQCQQTP